MVNGHFKTFPLMQNCFNKLMTIHYWFWFQMPKFISKTELNKKYSISLSYNCKTVKGIWQADNFIVNNILLRLELLTSVQDAGLGFITIFPGFSWSKPWSCKVQRSRNYWVLSHRSWTHIQSYSGIHWTLNTEHWTLNTEHWTPNTKHLKLNN